MWSRLPRLVSCFCLFCGLGLPLTGQYLRLFYPDIEQGSATIVVAPNGTAMLVDAGPEKNTDDVLEHYVASLMERGLITKLAYVVATHYDEDHIGRMDKLLGFLPLAPDTQILDRGEFGKVPKTFAYRDYKTAAAAFQRRTIAPGEILDLGDGVTVTCVAVNGMLIDGNRVDLSEASQFENAASVALVVRFGAFDAFIGGDLLGNESFSLPPVEQRVAPAIGDVDIYTVNHHGSRTSSTEPFLAQLKPEVAICQNAANNRHGHPNERIVRRIKTTANSFGEPPLFFQTNLSKLTDPRADYRLADGIADPDDGLAPRGRGGSIQVISDGAWYRVSAPLIEPVVRPCDGTTVGDGGTGRERFPPAILDVFRDLYVPPSNRRTRILARVRFYREAFLHAEVDGSPITPLEMKPRNGDPNLVAASLPSMGNGALVRYWIEAEDLQGRRISSARQGFFSGVTPISRLREVNERGFARYFGYGARVRGRVSAEADRLLTSGFSSLYLQDATAGIEVTASVQVGARLGDLVQAVGELNQREGDLSLDAGDDLGNQGLDVLGRGKPVAPQIVSVDQIGEALEGRLVRVNGVRLPAGERIPETDGRRLRARVGEGDAARTLTLAIDKRGELPGASSPLGPFDVVGIVTQYDRTPPLSQGYALTPRDRADLFSDEIHHPPLILTELMAAPRSDLNGDGVQRSDEDEFVELLNLGLEVFDLSEFRLEDGVRVRHRFPAGTLVAPGQVLVLFGGGDPRLETSTTQQALVQKASTGALGLNDSGDRLILRDGDGRPIWTVTFDSAEEGTSLARLPDGTHAPLQTHPELSGRRSSPGKNSKGGLFRIPPGALVISEVLFNPQGGDSGLEWIELTNLSDQELDLSGTCLGLAGISYATKLIPLAGRIAPRQAFVVGGPESNDRNANPRLDFKPAERLNLGNGGADAEGVALFNVRAPLVRIDTLPIDAVIYGERNSSQLRDARGEVVEPHVREAPTGASIERISASAGWRVQPEPNPNQPPANGNM